MNLKKMFVNDYDKFRYFLSDEKIKKYQKSKIICAIVIPLLVSMYMIIDGLYDFLVFIPLIVVLCYKLPYLYMSLVHKQNCNDVISAIPLWINEIYTLIEKNTIHNAIVNSYHDNTPKAIKKDLGNFIKEIDKNPNDKRVFLDFLARYNIDGFSDIMLKLFEFQKLSKDKLKHEIGELTKMLGKLEEQKRQMQFKNELFIGDTCTCFIIFVPCIYMTVVSLMPTLFTV